MGYRVLGALAGAYLLLALVARSLAREGRHRPLRLQDNLLVHASLKTFRWIFPWGPPIAILDAILDVACRLHQLGFDAGQHRG